MAPIKRSEFLGTVFSGKMSLDESNKTAPVNPFANKTNPQFDDKSASGISEYTGTFGQAQLAHLLRRTLFGVSQSDISYFARMTLDQVVAELLTPAPIPAPPINEYNDTNFTDTVVPAGTTWVNAGAETQSGVDNRRRDSLKEWWVGLMLNQNRSITEKLTLFWSNHFSTQIAIVNDARYSYKTLALLRANCLGNFKSLMRQVTTDPGMLVYLNGNTNTAVDPNENYGRESQELFTQGKGPNSLYTQGDVEAAGAALSGWRITNSTVTSYFDAAHHDTSNKQFSSYYGNTLITGQTGAAGATETDLYVDMLFSTLESAKFLCRNLYRWFVYYNIDDQVEANVITPLANIVIANNFEMAPVMSALLKSQHFFDPTNVGCVIKNPADYMVGMCRQFNIAFPAVSDPAKQYTGWAILLSLIQELALDPGDPPNVAGWPAYYQEPQYHELWINSDTLPLRVEYGVVLGSANGVTYSGVNLKVDLAAFAAQFSNPGDPNQLVADICALLSPNDLTYQYPLLVSTLLSGQTNPSYWTTAWNQYITSPTNTGYLTTVTTRLRSVVSYIIGLAEYQLI
jgi:uncharacterized protein (DUF1800 family)